MNGDNPTDFAGSSIITVAVTTAVWSTVTLLTPPESAATLVAFYRRTRPSLLGWRPIAALAPMSRASTGLPSNLVELGYAAAP